MSTELKHFWWEEAPDGGYVVNPLNLVFSINLHELSIVNLFNYEVDGRLLNRDEIIKIWKAEILNLRKFAEVHGKISVVRALYYQFYRPTIYEQEHGTADWRRGWKASWDHAKYLFEQNLDEAGTHLVDPLRYAIRTQIEIRVMLHRPPLTMEETLKILVEYHKNLLAREAKTDHDGV